MKKKLVLLLATLMCVSLCAYSEKMTDVECLIVPNGHMSSLGEIDGNIVTIYVLACPNSEVTRIQGTLVIKE